MTRRFAGSPTVRRRRLGVLLKEAREQAKLRPEDVALQLSTTARTILRWEAGHSLIASKNLRLLFEVYKIHSPNEQMALSALQKEGAQRGWWTPYTSAVRPTFATFLGLEADAVKLMEYSAIVLPGLLQTEPYMRAVMNASIPRITDETIESRIELRRKRQDDIFSSGTDRHFVIDESCLYRTVGGAETMRDQIKHLVDVARSSRLVTVQVLPMAVGAHASTLGSFSVMTFDEPDPPVACVELLGGDMYADGPDSAIYTEHFDKLREGSLPEPLALIRAEEIMKDVHHAY